MAIPLGITSFPTYGTCIPYGTCGDLERKPPDVVNKLMGRKLTPTPEHLTRAIYVPYHRHNTTHLPFYNVTKAYKASVGNAPVGGCEFKTRLCLMRKPTRNTVDVDVRFLINVNDEDNCVTVQERCLGAGHEANM